MKNAELIKKWNKILAEEGFSMARGTDPRHLVYIGTNTLLEFIDGERTKERLALGGGKRHQPEGHGPDD